jgi:hypothetical protein
VHGISITHPDHRSFKESTKEMFVFEILLDIRRSATQQNRIDDDMLQLYRSHSAMPSGHG